VTDKIGSADGWRKAARSGGQQGSECVEVKVIDVTESA
jgi:hypothetical protein